MQTVKRRVPDTAPLPPPSNEKPPKAAYINARNAALLSIVPGLGHFYIGQPVVGTLCLSSSFLGACFLATIVGGKKLLPVLAPIMSGFGVHIDPASASAAGPAVSPISIVLFTLAFLYLSAFFAVDAYKQALRKSSVGPGLSKDLGVTFTSATSFSYLMHCAMFVIVALAALFVIKAPEKHDTVIEIELEPPPLVIPPPPPPAPKPRAAKKAEAPKVDKVPEPIKPPVQPPKPTPIPAEKPIETPVADSPNPEPVSQPATGSSTGTGNQGAASEGTGTGSNGSGTSNEVDLSDYISAMEKKIRKSWYPPKGEETKKIILRFKISSGGDVSSVRLKSSSGIMIADEAAIAAVKTAAPYAPLPKGAPPQIEILFTFDYSVFGGSRAK
ncbi:MAG: TonB family protein [Leptolyngbya sp.]|nr:TonB family protein [Candidatus Melainabacteria bacterium]